MKTQMIRLIALLIFASMALSGCSIEYRNHHRHNHGHDHQDYNH